MFDTEFSEKNFELGDDIYLNSAYMGALPTASRKMGEYGIYTKSNPSRISAEMFFSYNNNIKQLASKILNCTANNIAIIPSVSYGMATIAKNIEFKAGQNIILVEDEMPSNVYLWQEIARLNNLELNFIKYERCDLDIFSDNWNKKIIASINEKTALVSIGNVHWISGAKFDLAAIRKRTSEVNALLIIDGTQSVGVMPLDVALLKPDAVVVAGYKWLLGPYSIGFAYYSNRFLHGKPLEYHWLNKKNSKNFEELTNYQQQYQTGMMRYDVGEASNFILSPMFEKSLECIVNWGVSNIAEHCKDFTNIVQDGLSELSLKSLPVNQRANHFLCVQFDNTSIAKQINLILSKNNIHTSVRGSMIRITPHVYNFRQQAETFIQCLEMACVKVGMVNSVKAL